MTEPHNKPIEGREVSRRDAVQILAAIPLAAMLSWPEFEDQWYAPEASSRPDPDHFKAALQNVQRGIACVQGDTGLGDITRFGAVAGRDSGSAIQKALDTVHSAYVPKGAFYTSVNIRLNDNNTLWGPGTIVATRPLEIVIEAFGKTNVQVSGIGVEGTLKSLPVDLIQYKNCTRSSIRCTRLRYARHEGISFNQSTYDCEAAGNVISDISSPTGWGIGFFWDIKRCKAIGNTIRDCDAYGILLDDGTSGQEDNLPCYGNLISGNIIETSTTRMWGIGIEGGQENEVTGNEIDVISTYGIDIAISNSSRVFAPTNNLVAKNSIRAKTGIRLSGSYNRIVTNLITATDTGVVCDQGPRLDSVGNEIDDNTIQGQTTGNRRGIQVSNANFKATKIRRNKLLSAASQWSVLVDSGTGATVADNEAAAPYSVGRGQVFNRNKLGGKFVPDSR